MSEQLTLAAEARERAGKGASRAIRRTGRVPAVIYGDKQDPQPIHVEERALMRLLSSGHFMNSVIMVEVDGEASRTLPKDVQLHPVTDRPMHVDFLRISEHARVEVDVPVRFVNEEASPGLKRGGVLNVVRHQLELVCEADKIPEEIVIALDGLDIGDSIHISAIGLPEGSVSAIGDRDFTIATVVAPSALKKAEEEAEEEEAAADEVPATEQEAGPDEEGEGEAESKDAEDKG
ncbi:MAG: 50S ribosomal protein L25/general stress protein Ctc [Sphingomonadaceae bacterium]